MQTIMIEIPVELKPAIEAFVNATQDAAKRVQGGRLVDPIKTEQAVHDAARECERAALEAILQAAVVDAPKVQVDGRILFSVGQFEAEYHTAAGPVRIMRPLYREVRNGETLDPLAAKFGMIEGKWLPGAARQIALLLAMGTSREAETTAKALGRLPYHRSSFERIGHAVGALYVRRAYEVDQALIEAFEIPENALGVAISLDRVSLPMEEPDPTRKPTKDGPKRPIARNYRMAYCATISLFDAEGETLHTIRYGSMPAHGPLELVEGLRSDVLVLLEKRPTLAVTLIADGAPELWNLLDSQLSTATLGVDVRRLIDLYHLLEKLGAAATVLCGEADGKAQLARWRIRLRNSPNGALRILDELEATDKTDKPIHDAITYIRNHHDRMGYASAVEAKRPLGSGAVEATCKSLVGLRMKRAGSRWKESTGQHIIQLRALLLSERWDAAMALTLMPLCRVVRAVA